MRRFVIVATFLTIGGVGLWWLWYLASAPGCTTGIAKISNHSASLARVTIRLRNIVVWRGEIESGQVVKAAYRIARSGSPELRVELADNTLVGWGGYVARLMADTDGFAIEPDKIDSDVFTRAAAYKAQAVDLDTFRVVGSCIVQSVLDLTGAPDPAKLN
ncbi:MAG: hypothetical protein ABI439_11875 [Rhodospirillales bacterium]